MILNLFLYTVIFVNFSQVVYSAEEADGMMIITVEADGLSVWPYFVEVTPFENFPRGPGKTIIRLLIYGLLSACVL